MEDHQFWRLYFARYEEVIDQMNKPSKKPLEVKGTPNSQELQIEKDPIHATEEHKPPSQKQAEEEKEEDDFGDIEVQVDIDEDENGDQV